MNNRHSRFVGGGGGGGWSRYGPGNVGSSMNPRPGYMNPLMQQNHGMSMGYQHGMMSQHHGMMNQQYGMMNQQYGMMNQQYGMTNWQYGMMNWEHGMMNQQPRMAMNEQQLRLTRNEQQPKMTMNEQQPKMTMNKQQQARHGPQRIEQTDDESKETRDAATRNRSQTTMLSDSAADMDEQEDGLSRDDSDNDDDDVNESNDDDDDDDNDNSVAGSGGGVAGPSTAETDSECIPAEVAAAPSTRHGRPTYPWMVQQAMVNIKPDPNAEKKGIFWKDIARYIQANFQIQDATQNYNKFIRDVRYNITQAVHKGTLVRDKETGYLFMGNAESIQARIDKKEEMRIRKLMKPLRQAEARERKREKKAQKLANYLATKHRLKKAGQWQ